MENKKETILEEAQRVIYGDRQADYGSVTENFTNIAKLWSVILKTEVTPTQVGLCMVQLKVARHMNVEKRDNLVDIAGYVGCLEKMEIEQEKHPLDSLIDWKVKPEHILEAEQEAKRFLKKLSDLKKSQGECFKKDGRTHTYTSKETGALKRSSLDLTRALSKMRNEIY